MGSQAYPSDVTDEQWALVGPDLPAYPGGRPRATDLRGVVDAALYVPRTGCQWRYPPGDSPPESTARRCSDGWRHNGTLGLIHDRPRAKARAAEKPHAPRATAGVGSQSVDATPGGERRGRDDARNVDGRRRHLAVDSAGLLLAVPVAAAGVGDAKAAPDLSARLDGQPVGEVRRMCADSKCHNHALYEWAGANAGRPAEVVRRPAGAKGWVPLPIRWAAERTFARLGRRRRLTEDREGTVRSSEALIKLAMIHPVLNRPEPKGADAAFAYHAAA